MAATDSPLKRLVTTFIEDFAEWLLGTKVAGVTSRNIELYADTIRSDQIFLVKLIDKRTVILHIEFQGRRTDKPMSLRELDYLSRLTQTYRDMELYSVVFYVGQGAGRHDTGSHQVKSPTGDITLSWKYKVIRLWEMDAEEIWALDRTTFLPLIGQTQIENPDEMLPKVVEKIKGIQDNEQQKRLLTELKALMDDEEVLNMLDNLIADDELLDTPFLRRIRTQSREDGVEEGREEGREEGMLISRRDAILDVLTLRFDPQLSQFRKIEQYLSSLTEMDQLERLLTEAVQSKDVSAFQATMAQS